MIRCSCWAFYTIIPLEFQKRQKKGRIRVLLEKSDGHIHVGIEDDGVGFDAGTDASSGSSLGLTLARILTEQLGGTLSLRSDGGVKALLRFPECPPDAVRAGAAKM